MTDTYEICIVGAGPAALSCAISAKQHGLSALMIEKGTVINSIINFPAQMVFFSTPELLEIGGIPFTCSDFRPTRKEAIQYYQRVVSHFELQFIDYAEVKKVKKHKAGFEIHFTRHEQMHTVQAENVVFATGFYDNPNRLNIPGEDLDHVSHYYFEPFRHFGQDVAIVGGKNSAVEAALDLHRHGSKVTLIHRQSEFKESIKYWILPDIQNRIRAGSINALTASTVKEITPEYVIVRTPTEEKRIPARFVYLLTGYHPDVDLLKSTGVNLDPATLIAEHDPQTLETTIPGIFIAGSLVAGKNSNRIFIENSREHGDLIINAIRLKK